TARPQRRSRLPEDGARRVPARLAADASRRRGVDRRLKARWEGRAAASPINRNRPSPAPSLAPGGTVPRPAAALFRATAPLWLRATRDLARGARRDRATWRGRRAGPVRAAWLEGR